VAFQSHPFLRKLVKAGLEAKIYLHVSEYQRFLRGWLGYFRDADGNDLPAETVSLFSVLRQHLQKTLELPPVDSAEDIDLLDLTVSKNQIQYALSSLTDEQKEELVVWKLLHWESSVLNDFVRKNFWYCSYNDHLLVGTSSLSYEIDGRSVLSCLQLINQGLLDVNNRMLAFEQRLQQTTTRAEMQEAMTTVKTIQQQVNISLQRLLSNQQTIFEGQQRLCESIQLLSQMNLNGNNRREDNDGDTAMGVQVPIPLSLPHTSIADDVDVRVHAATTAETGNNQESVFTAKPSPVGAKDTTVLRPGECPSNQGQKSPSSIWHLWFIGRLYMNTAADRQKQVHKNYMDDAVRKKQVRHLTKTYSSIKAFCECVCLFLKKRLPEIPKPFDVSRDTTSSDECVVAWHKQMMLVFEEAWADVISICRVHKGLHDQMSGALKTYDKKPESSTPINYKAVTATIKEIGKTAPLLLPRGTSIPHCLLPPEGVN
jgi:hypothetical protein